MGVGEEVGVGKQVGVGEEVGVGDSARLGASVAFWHRQKVSRSDRKRRHYGWFCFAFRPCRKSSWSKRKRRRYLCFRFLRRNSVSFGFAVVAGIPCVALSVIHPFSLSSTNIHTHPPMSMPTTSLCFTVIKEIKIYDTVYVCICEPVFWESPVQMLSPVVTSVVNKYTMYCTKPCREWTVQLPKQKYMKLHNRYPIVIQSLTRPGSKWMHVKSPPQCSGQLLESLIW